MKTWLVRIFGALFVLAVAGALGTYVVIDRSINNILGADVPLAEPTISAAGPSRYLIRNVSVLNTENDDFLAGQSVLINNDTIEAIGPELENLGAIHTVDGEGGYLVPGFTDSHVHLWSSPNDLLLYLANGVTQVREMHGQPHHLQWKQEIEAGRLGPDIHVVAAQLATYGFWEGLWIGWTSKRNVVRSPEATREAVRRLAEEGYDGVKPSSYLSHENYRAANQAVRDIGIPLAGHIPVASTLPDLWASQQSELAHVEELVKALDREFDGYKSTETEAFLAFVRERRADVARKVVEHQIAVTTTMALVGSFAEQMTALEQALATVQADYVNPGLAEGQAMGWVGENHRYRIPEAYRNDGWRERYNRYWNAYYDANELMLEALLDAGATVLAGTDANVPVMVPGFSLHEEMQKLVDIGMSPSQVLTSATSASGQWMGWNTGAVAPGYRANLVLLRDNPLDNIAATASIESVIMRGRLLNREDLNAMLVAVEQANASSRTVELPALHHQ